MAINYKCYYNQIITFNGFTPGDRIKKIGVVGLVSSNDFAKSRLLPSTYFAPSFSSINTLTKYKIHILSYNNFKKFIKK